MEIRHTLASETVERDLNRLSSLPLWEELRGRSLLITGAGGALGGYLACAALTANRRHGLNCEIYALCRDEAKAREALGGEIRLLVQDVREPLKAAVPFDYIIHAAGPVGPSVFDRMPQEVLSTNVSGTVNLLEHAAAHGCRGFVFASTHEIYGEVAGKHIVAEEDLGVIAHMSARGCYAQGKRAAETALACYYERFGLRAMSARLSRFMGPRMNLESGLFVCDFIKDALAKRPVRVKGDASLLRPLLYIADAAAAMLYILVKGGGGRAYNVQGEGDRTIGALAQEIAALGGVGTVFDKPETLKLPPSGQSLDTSALLKLGWREETGVNLGLEKTFDYYVGLRRGPDGRQ